MHVLAENIWSCSMQFYLRDEDVKQQQLQWAIRAFQFCILYKVHQSKNLKKKRGWC